MTVQISKVSINYVTEFVGVSISKATINFLPETPAIQISKVSMMYVVDLGSDAPVPPTGGGRRRGFMSSCP